MHCPAMAYSGCLQSCTPKYPSHPLCYHVNPLLAMCCSWARVQGYFRSWGPCNRLVVPEEGHGGKVGAGFGDQVMMLCVPNPWTRVSSLLGARWCLAQTCCSPTCREHGLET